MRIDAVRSVSQLYQANGTNRLSKSKQADRYDSVQISQMGKDYQIAKLAVAAAPEVRTDRVNELKNKMKDGTYDVSMDMLADKLMAGDL